jgi:hypothetical protein
MIKLRYFPEEKSDTYMKKGKTFEGVEVLELREKELTIYTLYDFYKLIVINDYK